MVRLASVHIPSAPTTTLPPLGKLSIYPLEDIQVSLENLREIFSPPPTSALLESKFTIPIRSIEHPIHDKSVPDSGYASAEEDDQDEDNTAPDCSNEDVYNESKLEALRADSFERAFSIKWLTGFITRSDTWLKASISDEDLASRADVLEDAASLLSFFTRTDGDDDVALTRLFSFPISKSNDPGDELGKRVTVELNDAPLSKEDHTSVGLQSWGSSILLADRFCIQPDTFHLLPPSNESSLRILELGAGTGMLSIVASKILLPSAVEVIATDFHPDVLANLSKNVATNFPASEFPLAHITVVALDWEHPRYDAPLNKPFEIILAADVIYHPSHAEWIKCCVERLLARPDPNTAYGGGIFWLIIPVRTTGRHEGMDRTVDSLFAYPPPDDGNLGSPMPKLVILNRENIIRQGGVGRVDEGAYKLFKIGWVN